MATDREPQLGDLAGGLDRGRRELDAARAGGLGRRLVAVAGAPIPGAPSLTGRGRCGVGSADGGAAAAADSAACVGSNVCGAAGFRRTAVAPGLEVFFAAVRRFAAAFDGAVAAAAFGRGLALAAARRVPIRSGLVDGSAASTPLSSFLGFAFFFGLSTLSAMALRVYGSRSGRGARPPSFRHPDDSAAPSYTLWVTFVRSRD